MLCKSNLEPQVEIVPCSRIGIDLGQAVVPDLKQVSSEVIIEVGFWFDVLSCTMNGGAQRRPRTIGQRDGSLRPYPQEAGVNCNPSGAASDVLRAAVLQAYPIDTCGEAPREDERRWNTS
jgi:hypothetical protein